MGKDPAVLFYTSDFLAGTSFFSKAQKGEYITLLCEQHQLWSIPEDHLIETCGSLDSPVAKKFKKDKDGTWFNIRMREETIKRKNYTESRRKIAYNRWGKNDKPLSGKKIKKMHTDMRTHMHMDMHMGNGNENENKDKNRNENRLKNNKFKCPEHLEKIWPDYIETRKNKKAAATKNALELIVKKLNTLAPNDNNKQYEILWQSIERGWTGVFPLSETKKLFGRNEVSNDSLKKQMDWDLT